MQGFAADRIGIKAGQATDMAVMAAFGHECAEGTFTRCLQRESAFEFQGAAHQYAGYQGFSQQLAD